MKHEEPIKRKIKTSKARKPLSAPTHRTTGQLNVAWSQLRVLRNLLGIIVKEHKKTPNDPIKVTVELMEQEARDIKNIYSEIVYVLR